MPDSTGTAPTGPKRTRLSRKKGQPGLEPGSVKVDRTTRWGNPFRVGEPVVAIFERTAFSARPKDAAEAVDYYRMWLAGVLVIKQDPPSKERIAEWLRGKDLACWCAPDAPCHADVLLEVANS
jgi:hypothetical protein